MFCKLIRFSLWFRFIEGLYKWCLDLDSQTTKNVSRTISRDVTGIGKVKPVFELAKTTGGRRGKRSNRSNDGRSARIAPTCKVHVCEWLTVAHTVRRRSWNLLDTVENTNEISNSSVGGLHVVYMCNVGLTGRKNSRTRGSWGRWSPGNFDATSQIITWKLVLL